VGVREEREREKRERRCEEAGEKID